MKTAEKRNRLLIALYKEAKTNGFDRYVSVLPIAERLGLERTSGELRLWVKDLDQGGKLEVSYTLGGGPDGGMSAMLTAYGLEEAEDLLEAHPEWGEQASASPSYISPSTIQFDQDATLADLAASVRGSNSASEEDREIALAEIAVFETAIAQPVIATDLVERFTNFVLKWIASKFVDGAVKAVVAAIIAKLTLALAA